MISYHYTLYYPQHFQLTFRRKYMYLQHDCYSHRFMKFPEKCKISPTDLQFPKLALVMIPNKKRLFFCSISLTVVIRNRKLDSNVRIISTKIKNNCLKHITAVGD